MTTKKLITLGLPPRAQRTLSQQHDAMRFIIETESWLDRMEAATRAAQIAFSPDHEIEHMLAAAYEGA